ncbi:MAG: hypothetical protein D6729_06220 [Deltaproteobacteria bacterium]|nr:MAG: hypothetical protein D6729_06220 [Deltaproteobacteria bacterium]
MALRLLSPLAALALLCLGGAAAPAAATEAAGAEPEFSPARLGPTPADLRSAETTGPPALESAPPGGAIRSAEEAVELALAQNPDLTAARARVAAAVAAAQPARAWADPRLALEYSNMPIDGPWPGRHPMSGIQLRAQQVFPFPGKIEARAAAADADVAVAEADVLEAASSLARTVREAFWRLALVRQLRTLTETHIELTQSLIATVRASYETGQAGQHNLLRLEVLEGRLEDELGDFDLAEARLTAALNAVMHRAADAPIATPERTPEVPEAAPLSRLMDEATRHRGKLLQLQRRAAALRAQAEAALAEMRPDLTGWIGYRVRAPAGSDPGTDFVTAGISIPLPWLWNAQRWGAKARAAQARADAAEAAYLSLADTLRARLVEARARLARSRTQARTYESELIPAARRTLEATLSAYQVGRADFATLYQAEVELLVFERTLRRARAEAQVAHADILALTGHSREEASP